MSAVNAICRVLIDLVLFPFRGLHPLVGLTLVSLVVGVALLLIFKYTSNQERLAAVKRRIFAGLFEIRLFNDDLRAIFRAVLDISRQNLSYLRYAAVPLLWMLPPLVLVIAQLQFHYGYRPLEPGDTTLVDVVLAEGVGEEKRPAVALEVPAGLALDSPAVWIPSRREMSWRLRAVEAGDYEIGVTIGGATFAKSAGVGGSLRRLSPLRPGPGFLAQVVYPAEPPLPAGGPLESIRLRYPDREVWFFGWDTHWLVIFFILSLVFAFALRNRFGVTI